MTALRNLLGGSSDDTNRVKVSPSVLKPLIPEVKEIIDKQRGDDYLSESTLRQAIKPGNTGGLVVGFPNPSNDPPITIAYTPLNEDEGGVDELPENAENVPAAVAVVVAGPANSAFASQLDVPTDEYPRELSVTGSTAGMIDIMTVHPEATGMGLLDELGEATFEVLTAAGCDVLVGIGWKPGVGIHGGKVYNENGFSTGREISNYWLEKSRRERFRCVECGPECNCSAVLFIRQ